MVSETLGEMLQIIYPKTPDVLFFVQNMGFNGIVKILIARTCSTNIVVSKVHDECPIESK